MEDKLFYVPPFLEVLDMETDSGSLTITSGPTSGSGNGFSGWDD